MRSINSELDCVSVGANISAGCRVQLSLIHCGHRVIDDAPRKSRVMHCRAINCRINGHCSYLFTPSHVGVSSIDHLCHITK